MGPYQMNDKSVENPDNNNNNPAKNQSETNFSQHSKISTEIENISNITNVTAEKPTIIGDKSDNESEISADHLLENDNKIINEIYCQSTTTASESRQLDYQNDKAESQPETFYEQSTK